MMRISKQLSSVNVLWLLSVTLSLAVAPAVVSQDEIDEEAVWTEEVEADAEVEAEADEIVVIGSRSERPRAVADSPVPVDVLNARELGAIGNNADLTDSLRSLIPSYNAAMASGDTDAFVRPTSLRGLAPDQTLVMVNGKRRHRSALIAQSVPAVGKGAHGPNIGLIPAIAIEAVELLRDGAGAQYGSDAIAGVINMRLKSNREGGSVRMSRGNHYQGEPTYKAEASAGFPLGENGFLTLSGEWINNDAHSHGVQRPEGEHLLNGVTIFAREELVGKDTPFEDQPFVETWGRPESEGTRTVYNMGIDIGGAEFYSHGTWAAVDGRYRFSFRSPPIPAFGIEGHPTIVQIGNNVRSASFLLCFFSGICDINTDERAVAQANLAAGYTPYFDGETRDFSYTFGVRHTLSTGMHIDLSATEAEDEIVFNLYNSRNPDLGIEILTGRPIQYDFYIGNLRQVERTFNADFLYPLGDATHFAFGFQKHLETFIQRPGEPNASGGQGASGFRGFRPENSGEWMRDSTAVYAEVESEVVENVIGQFAVRMEDFSDFGSTVDWKVAGRFEVFDDLALRGSASTGFHAPTPAQSNMQRTTTVFENPDAPGGPGGLQVESGTVRPDHPLAIVAGGAPLVAETSTNISFGGAGTILDQWDVTADFYRINISDRIFKTQPLPIIDPETGLGTTIEFFTNALDIASFGIDVVVTSTQQYSWLANRIIDLNVAFNFNQVTVEGQNTVNGIETVSEATIEDIENSYPNTKIVAVANTAVTNTYDFMIRLNYYGPHYDEVGRINGVDGNAPSKELSSTFFIDFELTAKLSEKWTAKFGVTNLFDIYPDTIEAPFASSLNVGLPYARRNATNFEGGSWYFTGTAHW